MKKILTLLATAAVGCLLIARAEDPKPAEPASGNKFLSSLQPKLLKADGATVAAADLAGAKQTLLYFSASWCGPCKKFTPKLVEKYEALQKAGIQVVLVNRDRNQKQMLEYMTSHKQPWPGLPPEATQGADAVDVKAFTERGIPSLALVDAEGKLVKKGIAWNLLPEILKDNKIE